MSLRHILLGMLREPASGYDLQREFNEGERHFWSANLNQIYPTLDRMEKAGWLRSRREPSPSGPQRRVYTRTAKGKRELLAWIRSDPIVGKERFAYLGQLISLSELDDLEHTARFFRTLRDMLGNTLNLLKHTAAPLEQRHAENPGALSANEFHEYLALRMGLRSLSAKVSWCNESLEMIEEQMTSGGPND